MTVVKVTFQPENKTVEAKADETLMDIASRSGIDINNLCGGQGVCGRCRVRIIGGKVHKNPEQKGLLDDKDWERGIVLSCQTKVMDEDVEVSIPSESRREGEQILTSDGFILFTPVESRTLPPLRPLAQKHFLELSEPTLEDNVSDLDRVFRELQKLLPEIRVQAHFSCLWDLAALLRQSNWKVTSTLHFMDLQCPQLRHLEEGNRAKHNLGVAVDVGTTTIVAQLLDLSTGKILGVEGSHNRQSRYGEDVISRMIFACGKTEGLIPLNEAVVETINALVDSLLKSSGFEAEDITCYVAAGNTIMSHFLLKLEPCHIRLEPYIPAANRFPPFQTRDLGLRGYSRAFLHTMPCVSSYVGGDISAGVLACGMNDREEISALIDVGTNGEIVIGNNQWLVCCSASAGPAFEGGGIKFGMRATRGAVEKVCVSGVDVHCETIGKTKARGICGSGLIDLMAELVAEGIVDQSGKFVQLDHPRVRTLNDVPEFIVVPEDATETGEAVTVTEDDISTLIKSKGAILAAMKVMLQDLGLSFSDLEKIYVAGGFGAHLNVEKAIFIGLLPDIPKERVDFIGNSSLAGARTCLLSTEAFQRAEAIARQMTYFELSVHPDFMDEFVASLFLPHTQMELFPSVAKALSQRKDSREEHPCESSAPKDLQ